VHVARLVACKVALAARADSFHENPNGTASRVTFVPDQVRIFIIYLNPSILKLFRVFKLLLQMLLKKIKQELKVKIIFQMHLALLKLFHRLFQKRT